MSVLRPACILNGIKPVLVRTHLLFENVWISSSLDLKREGRSGRYASTGSTQTVRTVKKKSQEKIRNRREPPEDTTHDWIGPPDPASNIRRMKFHVPPDETPLEKRYRERRQEVQAWNQEFWARRNKSFYEQKEAFIKAELAKKQGSSLPKTGLLHSLTSEELSVFYKKFLDENHKLHVWYNKEWYKKNVGLLWPALLVNISRLFSWRGRHKAHTKT